MELISGRNHSGLNPDAAPFVPLAYRSVEDYSPEWWQLVSSCPWFRDYWIRECFHENEEEDSYFNGDEHQLDEFYDHVVDLPDLDRVFHAYSPSEKEEIRTKESKMELMRWGAEKWHGGRRELAEFMQKMYYEKAPKIVSYNKVISPRKIHQPR